MPGVVLPPAQEQPVVRGFARIERIERSTVTPAARGAWPPFVFSFPGSLTDGVLSGRWYPDRNLFISTVRVSLKDAATTDHVIEVLIDGSATSFTLPTGSATVLLAASLAVGTGSYVQANTVSVTDSDLTVELGIG